MKKISLSLAFLISSGFVLTYFSWPTVLSQRQNQDRYTVRIYNVDDVATVYVNGRELSRITYRNTDYQDITNLLRPGKNQIRLVSENYSESFTYGFEISRGSETIFSFECGKLNEHGCGNDFRSGVVWEKTVTIDLPTPSMSVVVSNTIPTANILVSNAANKMRNVNAKPTSISPSSAESSRRQIVEQMFADGIVDRAVEGLDNQPVTIDKLVKEITFRPIDLNSDGGPEFIVEGSYSMGVCGSSGCITWIYSRQANIWTQIVKEPANGAVSIAKTKTNGYFDILLTSQSGAHDQFFHLLKFDGHTYRESSCLEHNYIDANGNIMKRPRITKC